MCEVERSGARFVVGSVWIVGLPGSEPLSNMKIPVLDGVSAGCGLPTVLYWLGRDMRWPPKSAALRSPGHPSGGVLKRAVPEAKGQSIAAAQRPSTPAWRALLRGGLLSALLFGLGVAMGVIMAHGVLLRATPCSKSSEAQDQGRDLPRSHWWRFQWR